MTRPALICFPTRRSARCRRGFTLIEVLVAVTLTLVMMAAVVEIFAIVGKSINNSRSTLEMSERIRAVASRLKLDLEGVTANMTPPGRPEEGKGYFEYIEGPIGPVAAQVPGFNTDEAAGTVDSTVGDRDDILQFTTRSRGEPFVGRALVISTPGTPEGGDTLGPFQRYSTVTKSQVAEVSWFLRGTTLYRRVLLVSPSFDADIRTNSPDPREAEVPYKGIYVGLYQSAASVLMGYYNNYDLSVHWDANSQRVDGGVGRVVCNTLADLTRRECRYAHPAPFPSSLHLADPDWALIGLPTLQECSHARWPFPVNGTLPPIALSLSGQFDAWVNPYPFTELDPDTGSVNVALPPAIPIPPGSPPYPTQLQSQTYIGPRVAEDVILTNVLSFDVKAWDPEAPILRAVNSNGTAGDLTDDNAIPDPAPAVVPGDEGYYVSLQHLLSGSILGVTLSQGAYVDLGYSGTNLSDFSGMPNAGSSLGGLRVWDTWSIHYEHDGLNQNATEETNAGIPLNTDEGTNGFDDAVVPPGGGPAVANGVVDDPDEREAPPPYDAPLRGIQIKIRVFDPDSQKVREVTVRQDFMKK